MNHDQVFEEMIRLELAMSDLYLQFYNLSSQDADFWWTLALEEKNHASLIRSVRLTQDILDSPMIESLGASLEELQKSNNEIGACLEKFISNPPGREEAFNLALKFEQSAGEAHFQKFMSQKKENQVALLLQKLNGDDKDHAKRILTYMNEHGIAQSDVGRNV
jgi:ferritin